MFTGIIESIGIVNSIIKQDENLLIQIESKLSSELTIDQSVAHNGVCLTVVEIDNDLYTVCAVPETISKTTIGEWKIQDEINLERCTIIGDRLDGHIVQGHVDTKVTCIERIDHKSHWNYTFSLAKEFSHLLVEKGSVTINGVSLTCFNVTDTSFEVAIIPYTFEHTNFKNLFKDSGVNIEFDIIGKYVARMMHIKKSAESLD